MSHEKISAILLAGGIGKRLGTPLPKQFLTVGHKPLVIYSLETLLATPLISEIIVVCAPQYRSYFAPYEVKFAQPGERRQDSVYNGFQETSAQWICIHDAARPFIDQQQLTTLFEARFQHRAVTLGVPAKNTLKEVDTNLFVTKTLNRDTIWEIHTPQLLHREVLVAGCCQAQDGRAMCVLFQLCIQEIHQVIDAVARC